MQSISTSALGEFSHALTATHDVYAPRPAGERHVLDRVGPSGGEIPWNPFRLAEPLKGADPAWPCRARLDFVADRWVAIAKRDPSLVRLVFSQAFADVLDDRSRSALRDLRALIEQTIAAGKSAGSVRRGAADLWADVWLELIVLVVERVAAGTWQPGDPAATQVRQAAWDAIRAEAVPPAPDSATIPDPATGERS